LLSLRREKPCCACALAEVGPAEGGDFELGFLPGVGAEGGALDVAVGDLVGGLGAGGGEREGGLEEDVGLVPVDGGGDADYVAAGVEGDVLDEVGLAPGAGDADGLAEGAVVGDGRWSRRADGGHGAVEGAGVDVPGVVVLGRVGEGLELVAAGVRGEELGGVGEEAGDAAGFFVDDEF
jgi:hypothetical protein